MARSTCLILAALLVLAAALCGCGDDPARIQEGGGDGPWTTVDLDPPEGDLRLLSVAASGPHVATVGFKEVSTAAGKDSGGHSLLFELQADGTWARVAPVPGSSSAIWTDLFLDGEGRWVLAGAEPPGSLESGCILDARSGDFLLHCFPAPVFWAVDGEGDHLVAGGAATGGILATSTAADVWTIGELPLSGTGDSGFRDVDVVGDTAVACGYDDGADLLAVILIRSGTGPWEHLALPPAAFFGRTLRAVALAGDGTVYIGGIAGAGGPGPEAFFAVRSATGDWTDIVLPEPRILGGVNDILIAADGSIYLACSGEAEDARAQIVRATDTGVTPEITPFTGYLEKLAEGGDGVIYAAGYRADTGPARRPVLLRRGG